MSTKELKPYLLLITYAGAVFLTVTHLDRILNQISWITSVIMPFTIALVIAFVLNRPYKLIRYRFYTPLLQKAGLSEKKAGSISGVFSILSVYFLLFFIVGKLVSSVIPELIVSIETFSSNMDDYLSDMTALISRISTQLQLNSEIARLLNTYWQDLLAGIYQTLNTLLPALVDFSMGAATSIYNVFSGLIISIYLLTGKDKLIRTFKKMLYAFLPDRWADYAMHVGHVANRSFGGFLTGQIIDSAIVGLLCFLLQWRVPGVLYEALEYVSNMNTPLAMLIAGATVAQTNLLRALTRGRVYYVTFLKLLLAPALIVLALSLFPVPQIVSLTVAVAMASPTATMATLFAIRYDRNAVYASELFAVTTILSALSLPLIVLLAEYLL